MNQIRRSELAAAYARAAVALHEVASAERTAAATAGSKATLLLTRAESHLEDAELLMREGAESWAL